MPKETTINYEEYIILKNIDTDYPMIARCRENNLFVYDLLEEDCIKVHDLKVYNHLFIFIKYDNKYVSNCCFNINDLMDQYERTNEIGKYEVDPNQLNLFGINPNIT